MDSNARRNVALGMAAPILIPAMVIGVVLYSRSSRRAAAPGPQVVRPAAAQRRTPAELREAQERRDREARSPKYAAEDEQLAQALARPGQWKVLPSFITAAYADPSGRAWFVGEVYGGGDNDPQFRRSVERAAAGDTVVLRGGRVLLVDKAGRFWGYIRNSGAKHRLECYDPAQKKWLPPRLAAGIERDGLQDNRGLTALGGWTDPLIRQGAFEDSSGNLHFLGGVSMVRNSEVGAGVHRRAPDGTWTFHKLDMPHGTNEFLTRRPRFVEQPGGRITVAATYGYGMPEDCRVLYFDGTTWAEINPSVGTREFSSVNAVIPLKDGSIATLDDNRLWAFWPKGSLPQRSLEQLAAGLESADAVEREKASQSLVAMGPTAVEPLRKLRADSDSPEAQRRLDDILRSLEIGKGNDRGGEAEGDDAPPRRSGELHGGRFVFNTATFTSMRGDGNARFYVRECTDTRTNRTYSHAFVTISPGGAWDVEEIPIKQWNNSGYRKEPQEAFEDSRGGVWVEGVMRTNARAELEPSAPDGFAFEEDDIRFEDAAGRVCVRRDGVFYVYDPAAPEAKPDLPVEFALQNHRMFLLVREREGWGADFTGDLPRLVRLTSDGKSTTIPPNWKNAGFWAVIPLKGGAIVKLAWREQDPAPEFPFMFWDGKTWHGAGTFRDLIKAQAKQLATMAGRTFLNYGTYSDAYHLAADGRSGLWYRSNDRDLGADDGNPDDGIRTDPTIDRFEYFNGNEWHAIWTRPVHSVPEATIIRAVAGGAAILYETRRDDGLMLVTVEEGRPRPRTLGNANVNARGRDPWGSNFVDGPDGTWWVHTNLRQVGGAPPAAMLVYRDEQLQPAEKTGYPLLFDAQNRFWSQDPKAGMLRVKVNDAWAEALVAGLTPAARMVQGLDGRLWLLHAEALSEIELDATQTPPTIRETGRWAWNGPRNAFNGPFIDDIGRLWLIGNGLRFSRFQLPAGK